MEGVHGYMRNMNGMVLFKQCIRDTTTFTMELGNLSLDLVVSCSVTVTHGMEKDRTKRTHE